MSEEECEEQPLMVDSATNIVTTTTTTSPSCCDKVASFLSAITIEPAVFLYVIGFGLDVVFIKNLWVDKTCLFYFNFSTEICSNLNSGRFPAEQDMVQRQVTRYNVYCAVIQHVPAVVVVMVLGAWSDLRDRRLPILVPMLGYFLMALGLTANAYWWPLQPEFLLICFVPVGLTGATTAIYMSVSAYISADTDARARTTRISVVMVLVPVASTLGRGLALVLFNHSGYGYLAVFGTQSVLCVVAILYVLVRLKKLPGAIAMETPASETSGVLEVLTPARLKKTMMVACRRRDNGVRRHIFAHIAVIWLLVFTAGKITWPLIWVL
nr:proton-coupled folate transporter-like [Cherax quadricarinatus]